MSIEETTYNGTAYATAASTTGGNNHIQASEITDNRTIFSVNNRFATDQIAVHKNAGAGGDITFREVYSWNPTFTQTGTTTAVADVRADFNGSPVVYEAPRFVYNRNTLPTQFTDNDPLPAGGFWLQTGTTTLTAPNQLEVVNKALNIDGSLIIANQRQARFKSYTHLLGRVLTSQVNNREIDQTSIDFVDAEENFADLDVVAGALGDAPGRTADIDTIDQIYQTLKREWFNNSFAFGFPLTYTGNVLNGGNLTLGATSNTIALAGGGANQFIHTGTTPIGVGANLTGLNFTTIDFGGNAMLDGVTFTGGVLRGLPATGNQDSDYVIDGDVIIELDIPGTTYQSANIIGNPTIRPGGSLTVTSLNAGVTIENASAGVTYQAPNIQVPVSINFTGLGGVAGNGARIQMFASDSAGRAGNTANNLIPDAAGFETASATVNDTATGIAVGNTYAWVYTRPGFEHVRGHFTLTVAGEDIEIMPQATVSANPSATGIDSGDVSAEYNATAGILNIDISGANTGTGYGGGQTNRVFELAKGERAYGEAVAKIPLTNGEQIVYSHKYYSDWIAKWNLFP